MHKANRIIHSIFKAWLNIYIYIHFTRLMFIKQELFRFQTFTTTNQTNKTHNLYIYIHTWCLETWVTWSHQEFFHYVFQSDQNIFDWFDSKKMESPSISKSIWNCDSFCCFCIIFSPCNRLAVGLSEPSELGSEHTSSPTASLQHHPFKC